jgi:hypothetical protein
MRSEGTCQSYQDLLKQTFASQKYSELVCCKNLFSLCLLTAQLISWAIWIYAAAIHDFWLVSDLKWLSSGNSSERGPDPKKSSERGLDLKVCSSSGWLVFHAAVSIFILMCLGSARRHSPGHCCGGRLASSSPFYHFLFSFVLASCATWFASRVNLLVIESWLMVLVVWVGLIGEFCLAFAMQFSIYYVGGSRCPIWTQSDCSS